MADITPKRRGRTAAPKRTGSYSHPTAEALLRPDVGTQAQFRKKKPPKTYRYDSSLSPELNWDGQNPARERGEYLIRQILEAKTLEETQAAAEELRALSRPFLNWAGKAERLSFDVPTLPLFIHERLSTKAVLETLKGHRRDKQLTMFDLFGDRQHPIHEQVLRAYEHKNGWVNRMILGDSLVVMNSLLQYEGLGGQVQMIYMDPPYGIKFGSNFQPFVRKRDVNHNDDEDMTREPEMVKAYRDTWELGLHSYLTYLRERLLLSRELLNPSGSILVQINDENLHHVREVAAEVFGNDNFVVTFLVKKKGGQKGALIDPINDYILWFAKDIDRLRDSFHQLYERIELDREVIQIFRYVQLADGREMPISDLATISQGAINYEEHPELIERDFPGARIFTSENLTSGGYRRTQSVKYQYMGRLFDPGIDRGNCWKHSAITDDGTPSGLDRLAAAGRLFAGEGQLRYKRFLADFGFKAISNWWDRLGGASQPIYVVQTNAEILKRCILMTTAPGDLVLDPTCGSGTTAYVAEHWGRRWITIDASRVPLALVRQRLLTATFPYYRLKEESRGPVGGFDYQPIEKSQNPRSIGPGVVPHITSSTIANDEPPKLEVLVDRPELEKGIIRVTGPFCVEATIPTPMDWEGDGRADSGDSEVAESQGAFVDRMLEVLRRSPKLHLGGSRTVVLKNIRPPAKTLSLSAEAVIENGDDQPVAVVFGPENGAISEKLVYEAAREAVAKNFSHLYVIGFAIQANARKLVDECELVVGVPSTYVQATPDLMMGDLLKNMRSSQVFSVCGLPEVKIRRLPASNGEEPPRYTVELLGLDVFDPVTMENDHQNGNDVPCWFLDSDYNGLCFHVSQAFFPRTSAWSALKRSLRGEFDDSVWEHLAGTTSEPFEEGEHRQVAVKVIDDRGNELLVVRSLAEAEA